MNEISIREIVSNRLFRHIMAIGLVGIAIGMTPTWARFKLDLNTVFAIVFCVIALLALAIFVSEEYGRVEKGQWRLWYIVTIVVSVIFSAFVSVIGVPFN